MYYMTANIRAGQKNINRKLKQFHILSSTFRRYVSLQESGFHDVSQIIQLLIRNERNTFTT